MSSRLKFFILILIVSLSNSAIAEDFLFEGKIVHPLCIASLIPSSAAEEVDYVDNVDLDQCMKSTIPVTSQNMTNINKYIIDYKHGVFIYNFLGNILDYSFFETLSQSTSGSTKNIVVAKYVTENNSENHSPTTLKHKLVLYDIITSGNKCNGSIVGNQITDNQLLISQLVNPALFLSIATNKDDVRGLGKFDRSNDACLGTVTQIYNIDNKDLTLYSSEVHSELYAKYSENKSKEQDCFNKQMESITSDNLDSQQTQDMAKKIITNCLS